MQNRKSRASPRSFQKWIQDAAAYRKRFGDLRIPQAYITPEGRKLGAWISRMRRKYKANKLTDEQVTALEELGMIWHAHPSGIGIREIWFDLSKAYCEEHGDLLVPYQYETEDGYKLGKWINAMRERYRGNSASRRALTETEIARLEQLGMVWSPRGHPTWDEYFAVAEAYFHKHGDLHVPYHYKEGPYHLWGWLKQQQEWYLDELLAPERAEALEQIGMDWSLTVREDWETFYQEARHYYEEHGDLFVPRRHQTESGYHLGRWIIRQRDRYTGAPKNYRRIPPLSKEEIELLNAIGMVWEDPETIRRQRKWESMYALVQAYAHEHGELPKRAARAPDGRSMGSWVLKQRRMIREGKCPSERIERLRILGITDSGEPNLPE